MFRLPYCLEQLKLPLGQVKVKTYLPGGGQPKLIYNVFSNMQLLKDNLHFNLGK